MSGTKNDAGKPDLTLVSRELMILLARVREFGNKKYERNNWKKGFKVSRSLAASLRHIFAFLDGETLDPESGLSHLGHAIASLEHAVYDMEHRPENDDRDEPTPTIELPLVEEEMLDFTNVVFENGDIVRTPDGVQGVIHKAYVYNAIVLSLDTGNEIGLFDNEELTLDKRPRFAV